MKNIKTFEKLSESDLNEGTDWNDQIPVGYYIATSKFTLSPGGGWRITINDGSILRYGIASSQKLESWDALTGEWKLRRPPISDVSTFNPIQYADGRAMISTFQKNTKPISFTEAKKLIEAMVKETVVQVKDLQKTISDLGLKPNDKIKITVV